MIRNPFVTRGMIRSEGKFWGRERELRDIYSLLLDSEEEPQSVVVVGLRRMGKSSLLYRVATKRGAQPGYSDQLGNMICIMLSMQSMVTASVEEFFETILQELANEGEPIAGILNRIHRQSIEGPVQRLKQLLRQMDKHGYALVLLFDEFECAAGNSSFDKSFFDLLRSLAQQWRVAFVVATQLDLNQMWDKSLISSPYSSPFFNIFQTVTLAGFQPSEVAPYLRTEVKESGIVFTDDDIRCIVELGGVHPFFLNVAGYHLFQILSEQEERKSYDPEVFRAQYLQDPTIVGNLRYYWENLTATRRQIIVDAAQRRLHTPFRASVAADVAWLERMGLITRATHGNFEPFVRAFGDLACTLAEQDIGVQLTVAPEESNILDVIAKSEGAALEFKSSLRWDYRQGKTSEPIELAIIKTLAAFLNTDGGTLLIGVDDSGRPLGLNFDYQSFRKKDSDGFTQHLTRLISDKLGKEYCQYVHPRFHRIDDLEVCEAVIDACPEPAFVGGDADFYIRTHNSTQKLNPKEVVKYCARHWPVIKSRT